MKKILLAAIILCTSTPSMVVWSQTAQNVKGKPVPDWVLEHQKDAVSGKRGKKAKPPRKIAGTAVKGAKQVSPPPKVKKSN